VLADVFENQFRHLRNQSRAAAAGSTAIDGVTAALPDSSASIGKGKGHRAGRFQLSTEDRSVPENWGDWIKGQLAKTYGGYIL
jgi:hypothetical protein